jgi:hypothetical protein
VSYDGLYYSLEYFELLKYLILGFHESYRDSSTIIVNKGDIPIIAIFTLVLNPSLKVYLR